MFENVEIKINNSDESRGGNNIDYSQFEVNDMAVVAAKCTMITEITMPEWRRPAGKPIKAVDSSGNVITQPGVRFDFWLMDNNGKEFPISLECPLNITYGKKMRSKCYKALKALASTKPEEIFQSEAAVKALLNAMAAFLAKDGSPGISCMVQISVEVLPATEKYPKANKRIKILELFPQPAGKVNVKNIEQAQTEIPLEAVKKDDFDKDFIPF